VKDAERSPSSYKAMKRIGPSWKNYYKYTIFNYEEPEVFMPSLNIFFNGYDYMDIPVKDMSFRPNLRVKVGECENTFCWKRPTGH
jgi:hypothetical protein